MTGIRDDETNTIVQNEAGMSEKKKDYFSTREAGKQLDVAVSTIQLWSNNGLLRAWTTAGGHRRIARSSVEEMLSKQQAALGDQNTEKPLSVVVVDDDTSQLRLYEKHIIAWRLNASVITATDGYEGLVKIGCTMPDIIITDLMMPNMDGFQMVRALNELSELDRCVIIVVTGLTDKEIKTRGGLPEKVHIFTKPISFTDLENQVRQIAHTKVI